MNEVIYTKTLESSCQSIIRKNNGLFWWRTYNKITRRDEMIVLEDVSEGYESTLESAKERLCVG